MKPIISNRAMAIIGALTMMTLVAAGNGYIDPNTRAISVVAYGAACDGVTDDTTAINNAAAALIALNPGGGGKLIFPSVVNSLGCVMTSPLNLTNTNGIKVEGQSQGEPTSAGANAAAIVGETKSGGHPLAPIIDATGANDLTIQSITLRAAGANASCIGVLNARSTSTGGLFSQNNTYQNVWIFMGTNPSCSGGASIGIYNYAAELFSLIHVSIEADKPIWFTPTNTQVGAASSYTTIQTGIQSMSQVSMLSTILIQELGPAITFGDTSQVNTVEMIHSPMLYIAQGSLATASGAYPIVANVAVAGWDWTGNVEGPLGSPIINAVDFMSNTSTNDDLRPTIGAATNSSVIFKLESNASLPTGISESTLKPNFLGATSGINPTATVVDDSGGTNTVGVVSSEIYLPHLATFSLHNSCAGTRIYSPDTGTTPSGCTGGYENFGGNVIVSGTAAIGGAATIGGTATVTGALVGSSTLAITGAATFGSSLKANAGGLISSTGGTAPTATFADGTHCGTGGSIIAGATNNAGFVQMGAAATACVVTFATGTGIAPINAPVCTVNDESSFQALEAVSSSTTLTITAQTNMNGDKVHWVCVGKG